MIQGAASKGFAARHYRKVYKDYKRVTGEVLMRTKVPPDYRKATKTYFQLIRPR